MSVFDKKLIILQKTTILRVHFSGLIISLLFLTVSPLFSQDQLGIRLDNYNGINTVLLNPANGVYSPFAWDINLVEGAAFFSNNYAFIENRNLFDLAKVRDGTEVVLRPDIENEGEISPETLVIGFYDNNRKRSIALSNSVLGPSFLIQLPHQQSAGIFTRFRAEGYSQSFSTNLSYFTYYNRPFEETFSIQPFQSNLMTWSELGLHYGKGFETYEGKIALALNARWLQGYEAAYFQNHSQLRYTKFPGDTVSVNAVDVQFGWTDSNLENDEFNLQRNGSGFAFDIGFNYLLGEDDENYRWKIGASLLDFGYIDFNKNAQKHIAIKDTLNIMAFEDYEDFREVSELDDLVAVFSEKTLGSPDSSFADSQFRMLLPAALSLQLDYAFTENIYLNVTLVQGIGSQKPALQRGGMLALTPRFEHRWGSVAIPLVVYNMNYFRVGAAVRLAFLTIGTDHLGSIFSRSDFYGTDFYMALKVNPFNIGGSIGGKKGKRRNGRVKCPSLYSRS